MYVGEFDTADPSESEVYALDFRRDLAAGETLSTVTFVLAAIDGTDPTPEVRLVGPGAISTTQARQRLAGLLSGTAYRLEAVVTTNQGNTKSLWGRVTCKG